MSKRAATDSMMRIAIAGAGGFAQILAAQLSQNAHAIIVLSTREHPEFEGTGCQVLVVDYDDMDSLQFVLRGVDLIISTICGPQQINLIDAARRSRVGCFVPSEFEGPLAQRPTENEPIERGSSTALEFLEQCASNRSRPMRFTVFSCGMFYERFAPGGLAALNMGSSHGIQQPDLNMVDLANGIAEIPTTNARGHSVHVTLTSVYDVARFVAEAVELGYQTWPRELRMRGAYLTPRRLAETCRDATGFELEIFSRPYNQLFDWLNHHEANEDMDNVRKFLDLIQVANGRYSFNNANLNELVDHTPMGFRNWLQAAWSQTT